MSELKGYKGKIRDFLISNKVDIGDLVKITSELTYSGILMPRYESGDENHIVLKLKSGYNIGIEVEKIDVSESKENLKLMKSVAGKNTTTVPQVVIDGKFVGGYTEVERFINRL